MTLREHGVAVTVSLKSGEEIHGWLYADNAMGVYVSLDRKGHTIRFIPAGDWDSVSYQHESERATFRTSGELQETVDKLFDHLRAPMRHALDRVDHNQIKRIQARLIDARQQFARPLRTNELALVLDTRSSYGYLLDELEASGLASIIIENETELRQVASLFTLPLLDVALASRSELDHLLTELRESKTTLAELDLGRKDLDRLQPEVLVSPPASSEHSEPEPVARARRSRRPGWGLIRGLTSWAQVALGGALAAGNVGIGTVVVVTTGLPTLGLTTAPAAIAIAASVYTGLNGAAKSLHDLSAEHGT